MSEFPVKEFVEAVVRIASADPDKVYGHPKVFNDESEEWVDSRGCLYVEQDHDTFEWDGSCLIGCALLESGAATASTFDKTGYNEEDFASLVEKIGWSIPDQVVSWAAEIQGQQDAYRPWGSSLACGDQAHGRPLV